MLQPVTLKHSKMARPGAKAAQKIGWKQTKTDFFCESCCSGKMTQANVSKRKIEQVQKPGHMIAGDIIGPFDATKTAKYKYAAVFVCGFSKKGFLYGMTSKN